MNPLKSRKQLLVAESELNRAQLVVEWQTITDEVHSLSKQVRTIGSFASAAASLVSGLVSFRRKKSAPAAEKPSWWQTILKSAGMASTFWQTFSSQGRAQKDK
jgi:hypothetical protein